jgi:hypothetical protein
VVERDDYPVMVRGSDSDGEDSAEESPEGRAKGLPEGRPEDRLEDRPEGWAEGWPEGWFDSGRAFEARLEARLGDGHGGSRAPFIRAVDEADGGLKAKRTKAKTSQGPRQAEKNEFRHPGLKKLNKKQIALDLPPTPRGCEWRRSDDGMNLWRCWTEWDDGKANRIKKSRYAGHLSDDAWRIMKEYDHEAFISTIGERLRRHGGR